MLNQAAFTVIARRYGARRRGRNDDTDLGWPPRLYRSFLRGSDRPQHVHTWSESVAMSEDGVLDLLDRRETSETRRVA